MKEKDLKETVNEKYSEIAKTEKSCCSTSSCCQTDPSSQAKSIGYSESDLKKVPQEAVKGLGCGNPSALADLKKGEKVLDLGSGAGIDVFLSAEKVGPNGKAIGIDMSEEMVKKSNEIAKQDRYDNVEFKQGEIENLPFEDDSFDVIISNCVINITPDKLKAYKEIYRVLKPGGRILVSDLVTRKGLPNEVREDPEAWAACIGGAMKKEDYLDTIKKAGFKDIEVASQEVFSKEEELDTDIISLQVRARK